MFYIDESYKPIFLKNQTIITRRFFRRKYKLRQSEYVIVLKIYQGISLTESEIDEITPILNKLDFIIQENDINKYVNSIYEKSSLYFWIISKKDIIGTLNKKRILLIGLGGIGTQLINHLISIGIKKYVLIDFDTVHISNLNRQYLYSPMNCGLKKVKLIEEYIRERIVDAQINIFEARINKKEELISILSKCDKVDIIINAADTPAYKIQSIVLDTCIDKNLNYAYSGVGINDGCWTILDYNGKVKMSKLSEQNFFAAENLACVRPISSSLGITNSMITDLFAMDLLFFLIGNFSKVKSLNKMAVYNWEKGKIKYEKI